MILKNAKIYTEGTLKKATLLIQKGKINSIIYEDNDLLLNGSKKKNENEVIIDCENKIIIPGIIDIHTHLRDFEQSEKETFLTGTKAAAFSGITTVFNMPNTKPPAITSLQGPVNEFYSGRQNGMGQKQQPPVRRARFGP